MKQQPSTATVWFAVMGGGVAWVVQFCALLYFTWAQCNQVATRFDLPVHAWQIGLSIGALAIGGAATVQSVRIFRLSFRAGDIDAQERRGDGSPPPLGRIHFLAIVALTVNFLAMVIVIMTAVGGPLLPVCQQA